MNRIHQNIASTRVTASETEVKAPKFLVRNIQLDLDKSDVPDSNTFSISDQHSDVTPQDLIEIGVISLIIDSNTLQKTTQRFLCSAILPLDQRCRTDQLFVKNNLLGEQ